MGSLAPLLPAALALAFAAWCGTFGDGATWQAAAVAWVLLMASAAGVGRDWRDPWRLGFAGSLLLWALLAAVLLSWGVSPVRRAGTVGVVLLPAFLWLPAGIARAWASEAGRRRGLRALSVAVGGVAAASLVFWLSGETPRPALPVGQHLHLTAWLLLLLPLAVLPWRDGRGWRWLAVASGGLAVTAVLAGRTLTGGLALLLEAGLALSGLVRRGARAPAGRGRALTALPALLLALVVVLLWGDAVAVVRGTDPSYAARRVYWSAGWAGLTARPVVGFGPGSTAWTLPSFLRPVPGVNPPTEVVGDLHLLPLGVAYETGVPGLVLALAAVGLFVARRGRKLATAPDPPLVRAGLIALAGGAVAGLATGDWRVTALPVAAAVAAGAALAGSAGAGPSGGSTSSWSTGRLAAGVYLLAAVVALVPALLAHRAYDLAVGGPRGEALRRLDRAVALDPGFPLYRARRGWLLAEVDGEGAAAAADSLRAARAALGVAPLWLTAGAVSEAAGDNASAAFAYERACSLDPLGALPPFRLAQIGSPVHDPLAVAARSLAADPRLAAAVWWRGREGLLERTVDTLATSRGLDEGWRAALVERADDPSGTAAGVDATGELALVFDAAAVDSVSLHLFRRRPWGARLAGVGVDSEAAARFADLPAATSLASTDPRLFPPTCTGAFVPQRLRKTLWKSW